MFKIVDTYTGKALYNNIPSRSEAEKQLLGLCMEANTFKIRYEIRNV